MATSPGKQSGATTATATTPSNTLPTSPPQTRPAVVAQSGTPTRTTSTSGAPRPLPSPAPPRDTPTSKPSGVLGRAAFFNGLARGAPTPDATTTRQQNTANSGTQLRGSSSSSGTVKPTAAPTATAKGTTGTADATPARRTLPPPPTAHPLPPPSSSSSSSSSSSACTSTVPSVVGYEAFQRVLRDRAAFFTAMARSATVNDVQNSSGSLVVARNFRLVRKIAHGCNGIVYEVKCIGKGHPELFRDQSYVLKVPFNYGVSTKSVQNAFENEYLISSTLEPHGNINQYFCHFTDRIPQEYYDHLPEVAKELAFDPERNRMHAFIWVVLEHHSETLEQFLRDTKSSSLRPQATTTTPWPIVHKYSRDICASLEHLFMNQIIHFDIKLDNIVISSNKEQAILIDLGCATKFPTSDRAFETETVSLMSISGNQSHRAPEIINGIARYRQKPDRASKLLCDKQPSFELGCILFELAMCGQHPLPGYPGGYGPSGEVTFSLESEERFPMKPPAFPKEFCNLVRSLLQCDPEKRMPLLKASEMLSNIVPPCPADLLSFYSCVVPPLTGDAGILTVKATCQILCGILGALTGKMATFTTTDVEFMRAIINKKHRTTLPELVLTALWTRHVSQKTDCHSNTQLILQKAPTAIKTQPLISSFLRDVICPRNEMMMEALFQLDVGNIDSALALVADATSLFDSKMMICNRETETNQCKYLPGLLFLYCLHCVINDHVALHQHIPPKLSSAFSHALCPKISKLGDICVSTLKVVNATAECGEICLNIEDVTSEWCDLVSAAGRASPTTGQQWAHTYFVGLWQHFCSDNQSEGAAHIWEQLCSKTCGPHPSELQIHWWASSMTRLAGCFCWGRDGVDKDTAKAVSLYQRAADVGDSEAMYLLGGLYRSNGVEKDAITLIQKAADAGNSEAMFQLGIVSQNGDGVAKDPRRAVTLFQRAADAGHSGAMYSLGKCYKYGSGVEKNVKMAVSLYQRATDAGNALAIWSLGLSYRDGIGVDKDIHKAVSLFQRASDAGNSDATHSLGLSYRDGIGVGKDIHKAVSLFQRASDAGNSGAMHSLGLSYRDGIGVDKDIHKAVSLLQRASDAGNGGAMCTLGVCYENGEGVGKDMRRAVMLYQMAADAGDSGAIQNLGACYETGNGVDKDKNKAISLYQRAADAGNSSAMTVLAEIYFSGGADKDINKAVSLYQRAADAGDSGAMFILGWRYENGNGVDKDIHKAVSLYQRAADAGDSDAMCTLAECYMNGEGVDRNIHKAVTLYQRAADAGQAYAMFKLGECYCNSNGVAQDIHKAVGLWQKAADAGDDRAMCSLALCYDYGEGVDIDHARADALRQRAAGMGNKEAVTRLLRDKGTHNDDASRQDEEGF
ncbi:sel1 repeat family protein [Pelomyxa schiedti]|nr:sel1 repeat family protein [Pelomyxa schiedti]